MGATNAREMENTKFVGGQRASAQVMMNQQDRDLEALGQSVDTYVICAVGCGSVAADNRELLSCCRLGRMGNEINEELREHNR